MQILDGGKKVMNWIKNSMKRLNVWNLLKSPWEEKAGILKDAFFPPAEMAESKPNTDGEDVSSSASYEDGADEEPTVVIDEGGGQAAAPSQAGKGGLLVLPVDKSTIVNSQYEVLVKSKNYKS